MNFEIPALNDKVAVYTTRPDTSYGVTFMALAAEHPLIEKICENNPKAAEIKAFCDRVRNQSDIERTSSESEKEGIFTGVHCINPYTGKTVEIWVTNYVLYDYGTGAVMGVPTGDQRDWMFADKYGIDKIVVVQPKGVNLKLEEMTCAYEEKEGELVNSGEFDGIGVDVTAGGGYMSTGVLEMSNVDLSAEFTEMITTQRGFQANSRIITVSDTLLEELVNLKR